MSKPVETNVAGISSETKDLASKASFAYKYAAICVAIVVICGIVALIGLVMLLATDQKATAGIMLGCGIGTAFVTIWIYETFFRKKGGDGDADKSDD